MCKGTGTISSDVNSKQSLFQFVYTGGMSTRGGIIDRRVDRLVDLGTMDGA